MTPTAAPVPPSLATAFGYEGPARYFAAYWLPGGDELMLADGQTEFTASNWHAWLIYRDHPAVAHHLLQYNLGSSDDEAEHWLVVDRTARTAYVAPVTEARAFLRAQWPPFGYAQGPEATEAAAPALTREEFLTAFKAALADWQATHVPVDWGDLRAAMQTQAAQCRQLQVELDAGLVSNRT